MTGSCRRWRCCCRCFCWVALSAVVVSTTAPPQTANRCALHFVVGAVGAMTFTAFCRRNSEYRPYGVRNVKVEKNVGASTVTVGKEQGRCGRSSPQTPLVFVSTAVTTAAAVAVAVAVAPAAAAAGTRAGELGEQCVSVSYLHLVRTRSPSETLSHRPLPPLTSCQFSSSLAVASAKRGLAPPCRRSKKEFTTRVKTSSTLASSVQKPSHLATT